MSEPNIVVDARPPQPSIAVRLNTHFTANAGALTVALFLALHIAAKIVDVHVLATSALRIALDAIDTYAALPALTAGTIASYLGRPKTIASDPKP